MSESRNFQYGAYWQIAGWSYLVVIIYLSLTPDPPNISDFPDFDKVEHFAAFSMLMAWFSQVYTRLKQQTVWAIVFCLLGIFLEFVQGWGGYRMFDVEDMLANSLGVLLGWWLSAKYFAGSLLHIDRSLFRVLKKA